MIRLAADPDSHASQFGRMSILWTIQLMISKYGATLSPNSGPSDVLEAITGAVSATHEEQAPVEFIKNTYQTLAYVAAASLACLDPTAEPLLKLMFEALADANHGRKVAQSFRILLAESEIMNKPNGCLVHPLRFQKALSLVVLPLRERYLESERSRFEKDNIVIALAGVFRHIKPELIAENLGFRIDAIMIEGTSSISDEFTKETYIRMIHELILLCPKDAEEHLDTIIRLMTDRTHNTYLSPSDASVRCRALALDVLVRLSESLPTPALLTRRAKLIPELDLALDDCSRDVRVKAQRTKLKWLNIGVVQ